MKLLMMIMYFNSVTGSSTSIEITSSNGHRIQVDVISDLCRDTPYCQMQTMPLSNGWGIGIDYYDAFQRTLPRGFDQEEIYGEQFQHPFGAAYICQNTDASVIGMTTNNMTDLTCLGKGGDQEINEYIIRLYNASVDWGCVVETPLYRIHDRRLLETDTWPMKPGWGIDRNDKTVVRVSRAAMTISRWSFSYYHFVTEALWRVVILLEEIRQDDEFMILAYDTLFIRAYLLGILQIPERQIIWGPKAKSWADTSEGPIVEANEFIYPSASLMVAPSRKRLLYLRRIILEHLGLNDLHWDVYSNSTNDGNGTPTLIYLSRNGEWSRNIENETLILDILGNYFPNWKLVVLGRISNNSNNSNNSNEYVSYADASNISNTIYLMNRAQVIIGPHGAGFSNIIWARPGTHIIELLPSTSSTLIYWHVADALGLDYWSIILPESHWRTRSLPIAEDLLEQTLSEVIKKDTRILPHAGCRLGTFYDPVTRRCHLCPPDTYNDSLNSRYCRRCPYNSSTHFHEWPMPFVDRNEAFRYRYGCDSLNDCHDHSNDDQLVKRGIEEDDLYNGYGYYGYYGYDDDDDDDDNNNNVVVDATTTEVLMTTTLTAMVTKFSQDSVTDEEGKDMWWDNKWLWIIAASIAVLCLMIGICLGIARRKRQTHRQRNNIDIEVDNIPWEKRDYAGVSDDGIGPAAAPVGLSATSPAVLWDGGGVGDIPWPPPEGSWPASHNHLRRSNRRNNRGLPSRYGSRRLSMISNRGGTGSDIDSDDVAFYVQLLSEVPQAKADAADVDEKNRGCAGSDDEEITRRREIDTNDGRIVLNYDAYKSFMNSGVSEPDLDLYQQIMEGIE